MHHSSRFGAGPASARLGHHSRRRRIAILSIPLFVPSYRVDECLAEMRLCLEKGWTGLGFKTLEFEDAWKSYTGLPHAHFLSSKSVFDHRMGVFDGDEVISTPITFVSTNEVILHAGLAPVFADVDGSGCLDPASVAERITPRTRAVMFVGLGGNTGRYDRIRELCRARGLALVLDAAHMSGTRDAAARHVGHDADATVFSFHSVKNLPTADGGMICFAREEDDLRARKLSWLGIDKDTYARTEGGGAYKWRYEVDEVGFKYHGNSLMAAIGLVQLRYLDEDNRYRRQLAQWYDEALDGAPGIARVPTRDGIESSRHLYQIRVAHRDAFMVALNGDQIFPGVHYRDNTIYGMYHDAHGTCPNAARASDRLISLPLHLRLTRKDSREFPVQVFLSDDWTALQSRGKVLGNILLITPVTLQIQPLGRVQNERLELARPADHARVAQFPEPCFRCRQRSRDSCNGERVSRDIL